MSKQNLYEAVAQALQRRDAKSAVLACRELNLQHPEFFDGWRIAGDVHQLCGKPEAVLFSTEKAESIKAGDPFVALQRIEAFLGVGDIVAAIDLLRTAPIDNEVSVDLHDRLGRHMASLDLHELAMQQYLLALRIEPANPALLFNLATAQRFLGMAGEAVATLDAMLELKKDDFEAQAMRSSLTKQSPGSNHTDELRALLDIPDIPPSGETSVCFALAKEYDDIDDPRTSFEFLKRGADLRRSNMNYRVENDIEVLAKISGACDKNFLSVIDGYQSNEPIFIVGLPRTGTTLVERIIGSHSSVFAAGELDNFGREMVGQLQRNRTNEQLTRAELIDHCSSLRFEDLGRDYIESTRPMTGDLPHFIDKLPFNSLYVGLIHRALPNARIINLERHPMATCFSVYKQLFRDPYPFSYDLEDLSKYYLAHQDLMRHWKTLMPGVIHTVRYEHLVEDTENETRELLKYCQLDWEDDCLRFYDNKVASTTASAAQVRQPVYRSSLDRWQAYREFLQPAENVLAAAGVDTRTSEDVT
jgi:tetratricopeptide (TPR) repeat protein